MRLLPKWILPQSLPAFYDADSKSAVEMTYKLYKTMSELIEEYNGFVDSVNKEIEAFETKYNGDIEIFTTSIRQQFQDFIGVVNLKVQNQDAIINGLSKSFNDLFNSNEQFKKDVQLEKIFIKYAEDEAGANMTSEYNNQAFMGVYIGKAESNEVSEYTWMQIQSKTYLSKGMNLKGKTINFNVNNTNIEYSDGDGIIEFANGYYVIYQDGKISLYNLENELVIFYSNSVWNYNSYTFSDNEDFYIDYIDSLPLANKYFSLKEEKVEDEINTLDKRITNIENVLEGKAFEYNHEENLKESEVPNKALPYAMITKIKGQTLVKNQLIDKSKLSTKTESGISFTSDGNGTVEVKGTASSIAYYQTKNYITNLQNDHKMLFLTGENITDGFVYISIPYTLLLSTNTSYSFFKITGITTQTGIVLAINSGATVDFTFTPQLIDLTLMYGEGKEPTTIEEFLRDYPEYINFNTGIFDHTNNALFNCNDRLINSNSGELKEFEYNDLVEGKKYKYTSDLITLNGSEEWTIGGTYTHPNSTSVTLQRFDLAYDLSAYMDLSSVYRGEAICDKVPWTHKENFKDLRGFYVTVNANAKLIYLLVPYESGITTIELFKEWLSNNNITFFYKTLESTQFNIDKDLFIKVNPGEVVKINKGTFDISYQVEVE